jgi:hypothetical protein
MRVHPCLHGMLGPETRIMKASLATLLGAAALVAALPAAAQSSYHPRHQSQPFEEGRTVYAPQRVCQPLCSSDTSPCDPPEFKAADGRCNDPFLGR